MTRALRGLIGIALALLVAWSAASCGGAKKVMEPTSTPQTYIFVQGPVDTVNHVVKLHWYGTDPHGYIAGYEVRLLNPAAPAADTVWGFTGATDTTLTVLTPEGFTQAVFEVRAINDRGVRDPQPARQTFNFSNRPPLLRIQGKPNPLEHSDTTFASVTVSWTVIDPDGNAGALTCRVWLDGRQDSPQITQDTLFTMPSAEFLQGGAYLSGPRTLFVQPIDDGGMAGPIDSCTWYVRQPVPGNRARLLVVDDVPPSGAKLRVDTLYSNAIARTGIDPSTIRVLRLSASQPFRSAADLAQTFGLFENVLWYRGEQTSTPVVLNNYGAGVGTYLEHGGRMFLESLNLITSWRSPGPFDVEWVNRYLNSDGVFLFGQPPDSSATWGVASTKPTVLHSFQPTDSVLAKRNIAGLRGFITRDRSQVLLEATASGLTPLNPISMPVALDVPQAGGGRMMIVTFPMVTGTVDAAPSDAGFVPYPFPQRASVVLLGMLQRFGLGP